MTTRCRRCRCRCRPRPSTESGSGNVATVTAALSHPSGEAVEVTVMLSPTLPAAANDFTLSTANTLTIAAGSTASAGDVTITAVDDPAPDKETTVWGTATGGRGVTDPARGLTLTVADGDDAPGVTLSVSPTSISENRNAATVTATLTHPSSAATTVTVTGVSGFYTVGSDATIVIAAGQTANASDTALVVAVNDDVHQGSGGRSTTVTGTAANTQGAGSVTGAPLTLTDNEVLPEVTLVLSPTSISENGEVSTVTATLSWASSEAVTVTVGAAAGTGAAADDFALSSATTLTIAAGSTTSAGAVTVTANDNATDAPNKEVTVSGTASGGNGVAAPPDATLTLTDDEALPEVALVLSPSSISESGGVSSVTAKLSHPSSAAVTVTVDAAAGTGAIADDFALSEARTLTIASGDTTSSGAVTVTANGNTVDSSDKSVMVSGTASGGNGVSAPSSVTLTLTDDETLPTLTLALSSSSISEGSGVTTVTAALSGASSEAVTVTVSAAPLSGATVADYALSTNRALVIAALSTASTGTVTLTAVNNDVQASDKTVTVSGAASGGNGVSAPAGLTLTITDNDGSVPTGGGTSWRNPNTALTDWDVTTTSLLGKTGSQTIEVTGTYARASTDVWACATRTVTQPSTLPSDDPGTRGCTKLVDDIDAARSVTIALTQAMIDNDGVVIVFTIGIDSTTASYLDAEWVPIVALPKATLSFSSSSISENGGVSTVTATLDKAALSAATLTVSVPAGDFTLSAATTLTFATGGTASTGMVTITATDNATDAPDKRVTVSASVSGDVRAPPDATLTITDDEAPPGVTLALSASSIAENGGESIVTATLSHPSIAVTTITVRPKTGFYAIGQRLQFVNGAPVFGLDSTIVIAAGETANALDTATVAAVDDDVYQGTAARSTTVTATVANDQGAGSVTGAALTLTDDDRIPMVTLALSSASISENGGESTVTAKLSHPSGAATTVTVTAVSGFYTVGSDATIVIAGGETANASDTATVAAVDDDVHQGSGGRSTTVTGTAVNSQWTRSGLSGPELVLTDDETLPTVTLALSEPDPTKPDTIDESGAGNASTVTAALSRASSEAVTVTVSATGATAEAGDFTLSSATTLTIAAGATTSTGTVTVTAVDDTTAEADETVTVSATVSGGNGVTAPSSVTLTLTDDEPLPTVTLVLSSTSISETGEVSTVTAALSGVSSAAVTVTVGAAPGTGAVARDFTLSSTDTLTIAAGDTTSTGAVTVTANGNAVDSPDKSVTVSGTASGGNSVANPSSVTLTLTDDDAAPGVTLSVADSAIAEDGGTTTVSAVLSRASSAVTTVTVTAVSGAYTVGSGAAGTIVIAAGETANAADTATIAAVDNDVDAADNVVTVTGTAANDQGAGTVTGASLTITDDDTAGFVVSPVPSSTSRLRTTESGGTDTFTVKLSSEPTGDVVLGVASSDTTEGTVSASSLTFTDSTWSTAQTVTLTGVDDAPANPADGDRNYTVTLTVNMPSTVDANYDALSAVTVYAVNADNEYGLDVGSVTGQATEAGGTAAFTVALLTRPSAAVTVSVTSLDASEGTVSPSSLTFETSDWNTTQAVTATGVDDAIDDGDVTWNVRLDPSSDDTNYDGLSNVDVLVTTTDDEDAPGVVLTVSPSSISENGGEATVTATLSRVSGAATTVTVTAVSGFYTVGSDATIVIAAGETANATDTATVAAMDDDTHQGVGGRSTTVTATVSNDVGAGSVTGASLTLTDNEDLPEVTLALSPASILESSGVSTVTATLNRASSAAVTVTVGATGVTAAAGDFTLSSARTLTIAAGDTTSTGAVTVTAMDDTTDEADETVTVSGTAAGGNGVAAPSSQTLTLEDDETLPTVTLALSEPDPTKADTIPESGAGNASTVTAVLSWASSEAVTVTVSATGATASAGDFSLSSATTLTIAAGATTSTGTVTVTAVDDSTDEADETVTVSATVSGGNGVANPSAVTLTLTDDETLPTVTLVLSSSSIPENGGVSTVTATLSGVSSEAVTVTVGAAAGTGAVATDFDLSTAKTLTIAAGSTTSAGVVTVTANDNDVDVADKPVTISGTVSGGNGVAAPSSVTLTLTDDDTAALVVSPAPSTTARLRTTEDGGTASFTVKLGSEPTGDVVLGVASSDTTEGTVSASSLTFTDSTWSTAQTVTLAGVDDSAADGNRNYTVTLTVNTVSTADAKYDALSAVTVYAVNADDDATADVNGDGSVGTNDVLVMYYAYTALNLLEDPGVGERLRRLVFRPLRGGSSTLTDDDTGYMAMLNAAKDWKLVSAGDVNDDGNVDTLDVLVMYYTYTALNLLEDPGVGERLRRLVFRPLRGGSSTLPDNDTSYMTMLNNAKALRPSP